MDISEETLVSKANTGLSRLTELSISLVDIDHLLPDLKSIRLGDASGDTEKKTGKLCYPVSAISRFFMTPSLSLDPNASKSYYAEGAFSGFYSDEKSPEP